MKEAVGIGHGGRMENGGGVGVYMGMICHPCHGCCHPAATVSATVPAASSAATVSAIIAAAVIHAVICADVGAALLLVLRQQGGSYLLLPVCMPQMSMTMTLPSSFSLLSTAGVGMGVLGWSMANEVAGCLLLPVRFACLHAPNVNDDIAIIVFAVVDSGGVQGGAGGSWGGPW